MQAVIFDLGNVLIDFDHRRAAERVSGFTDLSGEEIFNLFFDSEITGLFEEGKISPEDFFLKVKKTLNLRLDFAGFVPIWNEIFFLSPKNIAAYELALSLRKDYKTLLLTNINVLHFEYIKKNFSIFEGFPRIVASFEEGVRKPDPRIYFKALEVLGVSPQECFYTDDRPDLVEASRKLGINGFTFTGIEQLNRDLISAGVTQVNLIK
ncbi:MAG: HAD family phosphatase [Candidatus Omnitrophica bacterium]|nr:HAD family phosphatase [Candidatus Omnitrophota bacterium]